MKACSAYFNKKGLIIPTFYKQLFIFVLVDNHHTISIDHYINYHYRWKHQMMQRIFEQKVQHCCVQYSYL